ncbi:MAG: hypothetical protein GQ474_07805 [Sulfurimonas sp.]|nr:hypothetical protein [Sulfurimonas sp.]
MKNIVISIALTFIVGFVIVLVQMFTRETTLDGVRGIDFNLVYNFVDEKNSYSPNHIEKALKALTYKKEVLYPMAVLTKSGCIDNSFENSDKQICKKIVNITNFDNYLKKQKIMLIDDKKYVNHSSKYFIYKEFKNLDGYLIGHAGKYIFANESELSKFAHFLKNNFANLFFTQEGRSKLWHRSKEMLLTIFILSIALSYLYLRRIRKNLHKYNALNYEKNRQKKEWDAALEEQKNIQNALEELEELQEDESVKEEMLTKLEKSHEKISALELKEDKLIKTILDQSKKLAKTDAVDANVSTYNELNNLKKLWRVEPKWMERSSVESEVATDDGRTPFTITQAFITFDTYILLRARRGGYKSADNQDLFGAINFLQEKKLLNAGKKGLFHKIRMQRNDWFHHGKYPNDGIIKKLLDSLDSQNQKPIL